MFKARLLKSSVLFSLLLLGAGSTHAYQLDQSYTPSINLGASINEGFRYVGQTFTAGITGTLAGVNVSIANYTGNSYPLAIALFHAQNGIPTGSAITSTTLPTNQSDINNFISFPATVAVVAGQQFAIIASYPTAPAAGAGNGQGSWYGATGDGYANGNAIIGNDGSTWTYQNYDLTFRTYITPSASHTITLKVTSGWNYVQYFVVDNSKINFDDASITYNGFTAHPSGWRESNTANSTATMTFVGSTVQLRATLVPYGGTGKIYIDGVYQQDVTFNGNYVADKVIFQKTGLGNLVSQPGNATYEAEAGRLGSGAAVQTSPTASGGACVGSMHVGGSFMAYNNVDGGVGGNVNLSITYSSNDVGQKKSVYVNNVKVGQISFPKTGGWNSYTSISVPVTVVPGVNNSVQIITESTDTLGGINIDKFTIVH